MELFVDDLDRGCRGRSRGRVAGEGDSECSCVRAGAVASAPTSNREIQSAPVARGEERQWRGVVCRGVVKRLRCVGQIHLLECVGEAR